MNSPLIGLVIWTERELPSLMKTKLVWINVGNISKSIGLRCFWEPNNVAMLIVILICELLNAPRAKSAKAYKKTLEEIA
jgi:hypothetical protein